MQVRGSEDTPQFANKFRNYSKEDGAAYKNINNKRFILRRKNKLYCPNCKVKNETKTVDVKPLYRKEDKAYYLGFIFKSVEDPTIKQSITQSVKECGTLVEDMSKKTYDCSISNVLSNISIKDSFKVAGFATLMLFFISIVLKLILRISLGDYVSYVSIFDLILLVN